MFRIRVKKKKNIIDDIHVFLYLDKIVIFHFCLKI